MRRSIAAMIVVFAGTDMAHSVSAPPSASEKVVEIARRRDVFVTVAQLLRGLVLATVGER